MLHQLFTVHQFKVIWYTSSAGDLGRKILVERLWSPWTGDGHTQGILTSTNIQQVNQCLQQRLDWARLPLRSLLSVHKQPKRGLPWYTASRWALGGLLTKLTCWLKGKFPSMSNASQLLLTEHAVWVVRVGNYPLSCCQNTKKCCLDG